MRINGHSVRCTLCYCGSSDLRSSALFELQMLTRCCIFHLPNGALSRNDLGQRDELLKATRPLSSSTPFLSSLCALNCSSFNPCLPSLYIARPRLSPTEEASFDIFLSKGEKVFLPRAARCSFFFTPPQKIASAAMATIFILERDTKAKGQLQDLVTQHLVGKLQKKRGKILPYKK